MIFTHNKTTYLSIIKIEGIPRIPDFEDKSEFIIDNNLVKFVNSNTIPIVFPYLQSNIISDLEFPEFPEE